MNRAERRKKEKNRGRSSSLTISVAGKKVSVVFPQFVRNFFLEAAPARATARAILAAADRIEPPPEVPLADAPTFEEWFGGVRNMDGARQTKELMRLAWEAGQRYAAPATAATPEKRAPLEWLNGWHMDPGAPDVLLGSGIHCSGCGRGRGVTCVDFPEGWVPPEKEPDWPFEKGPDRCPVCRLQQYRESSPMYPIDKLTERARLLAESRRKVPNEAEIRAIVERTAEFGAEKREKLISDLLGALRALPVEGLER